jgi:hypothetical protein
LKRSAKARAAALPPGEAAAFGTAPYELDAQDHDDGDAKITLDL